MTATRSTAIRMGITIVGTNRSFIEALSLRGHSPSRRRILTTIRADSIGALIWINDLPWSRSGASRLWRYAHGRLKARLDFL